MRYSEHKYEIRSATIEDAMDLAPRLRQEDIDEITAGSGESAEYCLLLGVERSSDPLAGLVDGRVECMFGVGVDSLLAVRGTPWMLSSEVMMKHAKVFIRESRSYIESLKYEFQYMCNYVDARNTVAIRWLRWLGFKIYEPKPYGVKNMLFHKFEMERKENV